MLDLVCYSISDLSKSLKIYLFSMLFIYTFLLTVIYTFKSVILLNYLIIYIISLKIINIKRSLLSAEIHSIIVTHSLL